MPDINIKVKSNHRININKIRRNVAINKNILLKHHTNVFNFHKRNKIKDNNNNTINVVPDI